MLGQERLSEVRNPAGERKYVRKRVLRRVCTWSLWSSSNFRTWNLTRLAAFIENTVLKNSSQPPWLMACDICQDREELPFY